MDYNSASSQITGYGTLDLIRGRVRMEKHTKNDGAL